MFQETWSENIALLCINKRQFYHSVIQILNLIESINVHCDFSTALNEEVALALFQKTCSESQEEVV